MIVNGKALSSTAMRHYYTPIFNVVISTPITYPVSLTETMTSCNYCDLTTRGRRSTGFQTNITKVELELLQKILYSILRKHNYFSITKAESDSLGRDVDTMDMTHEITIGFRGILELRPLLTEVYHDVFADCGLCGNLFLNGLQCPKCCVLLHRSCVKKYLKQFKKCLLCKLPLQNEGSLSIRTQSLENGADASQAAQLTQDNTGEAKNFRLEQNEDEVHAPIIEPMVSPQKTGTYASPSMKRCEANSNAYCLATPVTRPRSRTRYALSSDSD
ncbi:unnamed protein product [Orchesella dallaii]|uniref:Phorbol-ester/DAG-type domain-containing protein n=1 Tax=Orchesella dallaii TaxID=48710 RepID=A0ABP1RZH0_9HEXA